MKRKTVTPVIGGRHLFVTVLTGSDQSSGRKQGAGRKAEGKPRLWAGLHQKASVCRGTGTVPTRVSLTLAARRGFPLLYMQTHSTLHECTVFHTVMTHMTLFTCHNLQAFGLHFAA